MNMSNKILFTVIAIAISIGFLGVLLGFVNSALAPDGSENPIIDENLNPVACTEEAMLCADGSYVGRTGPNCEFVCPDTDVAPAPVDPVQPTPNTPVDPGEGMMCTADAMLCPDGSYVGRSLPGCQFRCPVAPVVPEDVQSYIDSKSNLIKVNSPKPLYSIHSPLELQGEARGNWFFEASAPVSLVNWDGLIISEGIVTAEGDWMTTEFVPFSGQLEFVSPYKAGDPDFMKRGAIIFQKDNPSGLPANDDALEIPIQFLE